jgi:hypothetical protein
MKEQLSEIMQDHKVFDGETKVPKNVEEIVSWNRKRQDPIPVTFCQILEQDNTTHQRVHFALYI